MECFYHPASISDGPQVVAFQHDRIFGHYGVAVGVFAVPSEFSGASVEHSFNERGHQLAFDVVYC